MAMRDDCLFRRADMPRFSSYTMDDFTRRARLFMRGLQSRAPDIRLHVVSAVPQFDAADSFMVRVRAARALEESSRGRPRRGRLVIVQVKRCSRFRQLS